MDVVYEEGLRGRAVIDGKGRVLGALEGLVIDTGSWAVRAIRVRLDRGVAALIGEPYRAFRATVINVPVDYVAGAGDAVVLDRPVESLAGEGQAATH
jgi:sporulation protein YlmC with PRC-barrel domain